MANYNNKKTSSKSQSPTYNSGGKKNNAQLGSIKPTISPILNDKLDFSPIFANSPNPSSPQATLPPLPLLPEGTETINLTRETFNRKEFNATFTTNFTQLGIAEEVDMNFFDPNLATVGDFFTIYQSLFLQIPKVGDVNSHEFLIKSSLAYTQYLTRQEEIEALQSEIAQLQTQNLTLVADIQTLTDNFSETIASLEATNNQ